MRNIKFVLITIGGCVCEQTHHALGDTVYSYSTGSELLLTVTEMVQTDTAGVPS